MQSITDAFSFVELLVAQNTVQDKACKMEGLNCI